MMALSGVRTSWLIRQPPRLLRFALACAALRKLAKHREEIRAVGSGSSHRHRQRDDAALAHAAQYVAAMIEQARDIGAFDALQIILHRRLAFRGEQLHQIALHELRAIIAEQRLGAAVARMDGALGVEHHDAFGGGIEDGAELLGVGVAGGRRCGGRDRLGKRGGDRGGFGAGARENQGQRRIAVP